MRVYRIRLARKSLYAKADELDPQKTATAEDGRPLWTATPAQAKVWTKDGGAQSWLSWYVALGEPDGEAQVNEYEDPTRTIGGDDD